MKPLNHIEDHVEDLKRLVEEADYNMRVQRTGNSFQTSLDEWAEQVETEAAMWQAAREVEVSEPRHWDDVVSFGPHAVIGFLLPKNSDDRRVVFS